MAVLSDDYPGSFTQSYEPLKNTTKSTEHNNCKRYKEKTTSISVFMTV